LPFPRCQSNESETCGLGLELDLNMRPVDLDLNLPPMDLDLTISKSEDLDLEEEHLDLPLWDLTTFLFINKHTTTHCLFIKWRSNLVNS